MESLGSGLAEADIAKRLTQERLRWQVSTEKAVKAEQRRSPSISPSLDTEQEGGKEMCSISGDIVNRSESLGEGLKVKGGYNPT